MQLAIGGQAPAADVRIDWPSGLRQVVHVAAGTYATVREPAAVRLGARVLPADGASCVEVVADPAAAGAQTAAIDRSGAGRWRDAGTVDAAGALHRWLCAPASPGRARIAVSFDGTPLRVRPRVRFGG